jgi:ferritin
MLLDQKIIDTLNYRINQEELSSRIYEQMYLWLDAKGFVNFAKLYQKYASEEKSHSDWAKDYLLDFNIAPTLQTLKAPDNEFSGLKQILDITLSHEQEILRQCEELCTLALEEGSHILYTLAFKYVGEQREEIKKSLQLLDSFALTTDLLILDNYVREHFL